MERQGWRPEYGLFLYYFLCMFWASINKNCPYQQQQQQQNKMDGFNAKKHHEKQLLSSPFYFKQNKTLKVSLRCRSAVALT